MDRATLPSALVIVIEYCQKVLKRGKVYSGTVEFMMVGPYTWDASHLGGSESRGLRPAKSHLSAT